jgi:hypothetical protein
MKVFRRGYAIALSAAGIVFSIPASAISQMPAVIGKDSITLAAGPSFAASGFHKSMLGENYRAEWTTPIKVPVLDLNTFAGGLTPTKLGGGRQTKSLRFVGADSSEFVFRTVFKSQKFLPEQYKGTIIWSIFKDQGSASHPAATLAAVPLLEMEGILHPEPRLAYMPDDPRLGEYRKEFANVLGTIEVYPSVPVKGYAFAGAKEILDADDLLEKINADPANQVDTRALLRARLIDFFLNDNDRHPDQWKWAKLPNSTLYQPIPRDRDKVFLSYEGKLLSLARRAAPALVTFDSTYPKGRDLFANAMEFDRRMLAGFDRAAWQAEAVAMKQKITDGMIDQIIRSMPREYLSLSAPIAAKLRARRDHLPEAALAYYDDLWQIAEIHGTDSAENATITRDPDGSVAVLLQSGAAAPYFNRRFLPNETKEIRLYLHGGDDKAVATGTAPSSIKVRVVGGNGTNTFEERSVVGGDTDPTRFYDAGTVTGVKYDPDTVLERTDPAMALNNAYNRRPWMKAYGTLIPPQKDRGVSTGPIVGAKTGHGLGLVPRIGFARTAYGFRYVPYKNKMQGDVAYSVVHRGYAVNLFGDTRFRESDFHMPADAAVTQLDVVQFRGLGNDTPEREGKFYDVKQTAWHFSPGIGLSLNPESDITLGPIVRYTKTDSTAGRYISQIGPYGFTTFAQAGARLRMHYDSRIRPDTTKPRAILDVAGSAYPGMWDAKTAYESIEGALTTLINIPVAMRPVIALRGGGKKLFGNFPYFDAAFLGGGKTLRTEHNQRFAGDASLFGSSELRVPVAKFPLILPLDVGVLAFAEAGRVYMDGESPGGWHTAQGAGFWVGVVDPGMSVNVLFTNKSSRRTMVSIGFAY